MENVNIQKENEGYIYTIKSIVNCRDLQCPHSCWRYDEKGDNVCDYILSCRKLGIEVDEDNKTFSCLKVLINVKNASQSNDWNIGAEDVVLVDSEGFSYKGIVLCHELLTYRISEEGTNILPGTQVNYIQLFPQVPSDAQISKFKVNVHHVWLDFNISDEKNSVESINVKENANSNECTFQDDTYDSDIKYELSNIKNGIKDLKTNIYSCLNNELTSTERTKMVNSINTKLYSIKLSLEELKGEGFEQFNKELSEIKTEFKNKIKKVKEEELRKRGAAQKIEDLLALTPREFEEYVGQLYKSMGYEVEVTQYSNDKGVDIIMYKDYVKYVVQCKRYKGTVGSPDIQKFIGAMDHAKADKGIFVTTGMFSFEAEKMAKEHPIVLVNRIDLAKLIVNELSK